jgi:hypothetical protein
VSSRVFMSSSKPRNLRSSPLLPFEALREFEKPHPLVQPNPTAGDRPGDPWRPIFSDQRVASQKRGFLRGYVEPEKLQGKVG